MGSARVSTRPTRPRFFPIRFGFRGHNRPSGYSPFRLLRDAFRKPVHVDDAEFVKSPADHFGLVMGYELKGDLASIGMVDTSDAGYGIAVRF